MGMTLVLKVIPPSTPPPCARRVLGGVRSRDKGLGGLRLMFTAPFVLGALICYPEWMALPALFVGVIAFLFYQIPTRRI